MKLIVAPDGAAEISPRSEPSPGTPVSLRLVTVGGGVATWTGLPLLTPLTVTEALRLPPSGRSGS